MVSIAAFQAVDPGSIPGRRMNLFLCPSHITKYSESLNKNILVVSIGMQAQYWF